MENIHKKYLISKTQENFRAFLINKYVDQITVEQIYALKPNNIKCKYTFIDTKNENISVKVDYIKNNNTTSWKRSTNDINLKWKNKNEDDKNKLICILNKISNDNYNELIKDIKKLNYINAGISNLIIIKATNEPNYSNIYSNICKDLQDIQESVINNCNEQFKNNKNKNLCFFIGVLYKNGIIKIIDPYVNNLSTFYIDNILDKEKDIEILCILVKAIGFKNETLKNTIIYLNKLKNEKINMRTKFMIMDILNI